MEEGRNVLTKDDIETVDVADLNKEQSGEARSDATEKCPRCFGVDGHHLMNCPEAGGPEEEGTVKVTSEIPSDVAVEVDPAVDQISRDLSQEEIQEHFDTADGLFEGKKFEDGAVVEEEKPQTMEEFADEGGMSNINDEREPAEATEEIGLSDAIAKSDKLPPSEEELLGNDMLWLIAKLCHETNRQFSAQICGDHSHLPWEETLPSQRESVYAGVVGVYENPNLTPEESHEAWCVYKLSRGWEFGNLKSEEHRTHPNLIPYHQLHVHERFKDTLFTTICKTMLGGAK